jgi:hypothetical protein
MPRARLVAIAGLPLLAALLMAKPAMAQFDLFRLNSAPPPQPTPAKPAPPAQPKKTAPAAGPAKPAAAAGEKTTPIPKPKPSALKTPEPNKVDAKKPETSKVDAKKPDKKPDSKPGPAKYTLADYHKVWDVTAQTTRADIVARFGEPQRVGDSERKPLYYFNDTLTFFFTGDDTVGTMIVGNSFEQIQPNTIPPEVIGKAFIGRSRDDVLKAFGPATAVSSENYRYMPAAGPYKVEFQCYDFKKYVCGQLLVQF